MKEIKNFINLIKFIRKLYTINLNENFVSDFFLSSRLALLFNCFLPLYFFPIIKTTLLNFFFDFLCSILVLE